MEKAILYDLSLIGASYCEWKSGNLTEFEPAYNGTNLVDRQIIFKKGIFCAGLVNVMLTSINLEVPKYYPWNGGIYFYQINYPYMILI